MSRRTAAPIRVRSVQPRWGWHWYCMLHDCLDWGASYSTPGRAADAGREHHRLWHTDLPI